MMRIKEVPEEERERFSQDYMGWAAVCELHAENLLKLEGVDNIWVKHLFSQADYWYTKAIAAYTG